MLRLKHKNVFLKDRKLVEKRGKDLSKLAEIMMRLAMCEKLDLKHRDHPLIGSYKGFRECHIENDWLLVYKITDEEIIFERTGTHADLFK